MSDPGGLIFLILLGGWCAARKMARKTQKSCNITQTVTFPVEVQKDYRAEVREIIRLIDEEVQILKKTREPETAVKCFAAIRRYLATLAAESPLRTRVSILMGDKEIGHELVVGSADELAALKQFEKEWLTDHFSERSEILLKRSEETDDSVLRIELARDGLRSALKGLEYLPGDEKLATMADLAERRLRFLNGRK